MPYGRLNSRILSVRFLERRFNLRSASGAGQNVGSRLKKLLLYTTSVTTAGLLGSVGYAYVDPHFRKSFERSVPGASYVFLTLYGDSSEIPPRETIKPSNRDSNISRQSRAQTSPPPLFPAELPLQERINSSDLPNGLKDREELTKLIDNILDKKLSILTSAQKMELTEKVQLARSEFENELQKELMKQSSMHALHEEQMLRSQRENMIAEHKKELQGVILMERQEYMRSLSQAIAQLTALEVFLNGRAEFDSQNRRAKKLWISCQNLKNLLRKTSLHDGQSHVGYSTRIHLAHVINDIKDASESDGFTKLLLKSVPEQVVNVGVFNENDLIRRYEKVKLLCKRLARVGDGGAGLFRYLLSYLQSFLIWDTEKHTLPESHIDFKDLSVYEILSRTSYCIKNKDYESAIRLMSMLKGEPSRVASDWIADLRTHVEMVQLSDLMIAHASAQSIRSLY